MGFEELIIEDFKIVKHLSDSGLSFVDVIPLAVDFEQYSEVHDSPKKAEKRYKALVDYFKKLESLGKLPLRPIFSDEEY